MSGKKKTMVKYTKILRKRLSFFVPYILTDSRKDANFIFKIIRLAVGKKEE